MSLFQQIVSRCRADERDENIFLIEEGPNSITVETLVDVSPAGDAIPISHRYTITDPEIIDRAWINSRLVLSSRAIELDREKILDWISSSIEPEFLSSLECILIIEDNSEDEWDVLVEQDPRIREALVEQSVDLPRDGAFGVLWYLSNIPVIVWDTARKGRDPFDANLQLLFTIAHEIRHLAQSNGYLPEEVLRRKFKDDEEDADWYAGVVLRSHFEWLIKKEE